MKGKIIAYFILGIGLLGAFIIYVQNPPTPILIGTILILISYILMMNHIKVSKKIKED